jgi:hypothetical protein
MVGASGYWVGTSCFAVWLEAGVRFPHLYSWPIVASSGCVGVFLFAFVYLIFVRQALLPTEMTSVELVTTLVYPLVMLMLKNKNYQVLVLFDIF